MFELQNTFTVLQSKLGVLGGLSETFEFLIAHVIAHHLYEYKQGRISGLVFGVLLFSLHVAMWNTNTESNTTTYYLTLESKAAKRAQRQRRTSHIKAAKFYHMAMMRYVLLYLRALGSGKADTSASRGRGFDGSWQCS